MAEYVWIRDNETKHQYPILASQAETLGDAVRVDPDHPTHSTNGELLPPKYYITLPSGDPLNSMTVAELKDEIDRRNVDRDPEGEGYITVEEPGNKPELLAALQADTE